MNTKMFKAPFVTVNGKDFDCVKFSYDEEKKVLKVYGDEYSTFEGVKTFKNMLQNCFDDFTKEEKAILVVENTLLVLEHRDEKAKYACEKVESILNGVAYMVTLNNGKNIVIKTNCIQSIKYKENKTVYVVFKEKGDFLFCCDSIEWFIK